MDPSLLLRGPVSRTVVALDGSQRASLPVNCPQTAQAVGLEVVEVPQSFYAVDALLKYYSTLLAFQTSQQLVTLIVGKEDSYLQLSAWEAHDAQQGARQPREEAHAVEELANAFAAVTDRRTFGPSVAEHLDWAAALHGAVECIQDSVEEEEGVCGEAASVARPAPGPSMPAARGDSVPELENRGRVLLIRFESGDTLEGPSPEALLSSLSKLLHSSNEPVGWPLGRCDVVLLRVTQDDGSPGADAADSPTGGSTAAALNLKQAQHASRWEDGHFLSAVSVKTNPRELSDLLVHLADVHLGVQRTHLSGIPMSSSKRKRTAAEEKDLYRVELKCRPLPQVDGSDAAADHADGVGQDLQWLMVPQPLQGYWNKQPAISIWQVCLSSPGSGPSQSLLSHLNAGKPAYMAPSASRTAQQGIPSHVMLRRGQGLYIHRLHNVNPEAIPRDMMIDTEEGINELRVGNFSNILLDCVSDALPDKLSLSSASEPSSSALRNRKETDLVTCEGQPFRVPSCRRLERMTRFMPLTVKESVADSIPALAPAVRPIIDCLQSPQIDPTAFHMLRPILQALESNSRSNDGVLLHNGVLDPAARRKLYGQAWAELERAASALGNISNEHQALMNAVNIHKPRPEPPPTPRLQPHQGQAAPGAPQPNRHPLRPDDPGKPGPPATRLPLQLGPSLTIVALGRVIPERPGYHSQSYIWPVGFRSQRMYASYMTQHTRAMYLNEILDGGPNPEFRVTAEDDPQHPITGNSSSGVWAQVVRRVAALRGPVDGEPLPTGKQLSHVSGPEQFGFGHPAVAKMIQELPGADRIKRGATQVPGGGIASAVPRPGNSQQQNMARPGVDPSQAGGGPAGEGAAVSVRQQQLAASRPADNVKAPSAVTAEAAPPKPTPPVRTPRQKLPLKQRAEAARELLLGRCSTAHEEEILHQPLQSGDIGETPESAAASRLTGGRLEGSLLLRYWTGQLMWPTPEWAQPAVRNIIGEGAQAQGTVGDVSMRDQQRRPPEGIAQLS